MPKYDQKNPPPFHLNVNNPSFYNYYPYNEGYNNNLPNIPNKNNTEKINNNNNNINEKVKENHKKKKNNKNTEIREKKKNKEEQDFSIDINIMTKDIVEVIIPVKEGKNKNKIWKKGYNKKELIGTVINDYLTENELNLPDDDFSQLKCFNKPVSFQDEIELLLPKDLELDDNNINNNINNNENNINNNIINNEEQKYPEIIGKPFYDPFEILCFYKTQKKFITLNFNDKIIKDKINIENFNITSAYCNGYNHLYLSGGEKSLNSFWDINLKKNIINPPYNNMPPKKHHSMIYIPKKKVFIVGGNSLSTFYFNLKENKLIKWSKLNIIRIEPALQVVNNKLYCFDITNSDDYSYEFTELDSKNDSKWKFIKPKINLNNLFNQQLFGLAKDLNNNIVFLGGSFKNEYIIDNNNKVNFMFDVQKNEIYLSEIKYKKFNLKERGFCPFNKTYDYILTDFPRTSPQICFFNKKKSKLELINFSQDNDSKNSSLTNNNIKKDNTINNISPVFSFGKNNINENQNILSSNLGLRNPNKNIKYNTINESNIIKNNNNYIKQETPQFLNNNNNYIINNNTKFMAYDRNTINAVGKTPERNVYRYRRINYPKTEIIQNEKNHSADSRKFYYPRSGLKSNHNMNNKIYNYYQAKKY